MVNMTHAMVVEEYQGPLQCRNWRISAPGPLDVIVKVQSCGLNFADTLMIDGKYQETPAIPFVPGMEICGEIQEIGTEVHQFQPKDRIAAFCGHGGLAGHVVVPAARCLPVPDSMTDDAAAGFMIAYGTSHLALTRRARLVSGETLVVLGAAGGVGLTAVEVGKALGARVIAVARGPEKLAMAKSAGADVLIEADTDDLRGALKAVGPVDVVYDPVGGAAGEAALRALAPEGRHLLIGFASGGLPQLRPNHLMVKNTTVIGINWGGYLRFRPDLLIDSLSELMRWHGEGRISPHISQVLPFAQAEDGLNLLRSRQATGKIVVRL